ncbi:MAG: hypothetical protein ACE5GN_00310 [Waddliaceae bacterium]
MSLLLFRFIAGRLLGGVCFLFLFQSLLPSIGHAQEGQFYPNPGIVAMKGGKLIGSDHLYNLTDKIAIFVEIFKPKEVEVPITEEMLRGRIEEIFKKAGMQPFSDASPGQPIHPFFHLLIMLNPIERGYAVYCQGRLFEKIEMNRVKLAEQTTFQGITWETSNLIVTPTDRLTNQVDNVVDDIATTFTERYKFFENIRSQMQRK